MRWAGPVPQEFETWPNIGENRPCESPVLPVGLSIPCARREIAVVIMSGTATSQGGARVTGSAGNRATPFGSVLVLVSEAWDGIRHGGWRRCSVSRNTQYPPRGLSWAA